MGNGSPRWKVMIRHSRRPMTKEGFLDASKKGIWSLTPVGRQAAQGKRSGTDKAGRASNLPESLCKQLPGSFEKTGSAAPSEEKGFDERERTKGTDRAFRK